MKYSAALALSAFLATSAAYAAPFTGKGLPADTLAFVHMDGEAAANGEFTQAIKSLSQSGGKKQDGELQKVFAECGISGDAITDLSVGLVRGANGKPDMSGLVHGKFDAAKFKGIPARHPGVGTKTAGGLTWLNTDDIAAIAGAKKANAKASPENTVYVAMSGSDTLIFSTVTRLDKAAAAASGKAASFAVPSDAKASLAGSPSLVGWFPEAAVKAFKGDAAQQGGPDLKALAFSLGETSGNVNFNAIATMADAQTAQQTNAMIPMFQFGAVGQLAPKPNATAKEKADSAFLISLIQALKFSADGANLKADFNFPSAQLAAKLTENKAEIIKAAEGAAK